MEVAIATMSSKGQIVIPLEMRKDIVEGEKLLIIQSNNRLIMKKASNMDESLSEDIEFAKKTEDALRRYEKGEFKSMGADEFLNELEKW